MAFIFSLFSCCTSNDRSSKVQAETRHARIIAVSHDYYNRPHSPLQRQQYHDSPPEYKDIAQHLPVTVDEKHPLQFELIVDQDEDHVPPPGSHRSSIVSIPSTRLTRLTSAPTGETTRTTQRQSLERASTRGTLPPSYYSNRSPSPASSAGLSSDNERDAVWQHPVMSSNWLEVLQEDAFRRVGATTNSEEQDQNNTRGARFG